VVEPSIGFLCMLCMCFSRSSSSCFRSVEVGELNRRRTTSKRRTTSRVFDRCNVLSTGDTELSDPDVIEFCVDGALGLSEIS
jgi:hypothetical protein